MQRPELDQDPPRNVPTPAHAPASAPAPDARVAEQVAVDVAIRLGSIALGVFVVFLLVQPFAALLLWACILAVSLFPIFAWLRNRLGGSGKLAAALLTVFALLMVFGPVAVLLSSLVVSLETFAVSLRAGGVHVPELPPHVAAFEIFGRTLGSVWTQLTSQLHGYVNTHAHTLLGTGEHALRAVAALASSVLVFAGAVLVAGLLYGPGPRVLALMNRGLHKISGPRGLRFLDVAIATVRGVARGVIGVALLQALCSGIVFLFAGIPHAGLLALLVLVLAMSQIGANFVLVPVTVWAWATWPPLSALVFTLSVIVIMAMDYVLKPLVMRQGYDAPIIAVFLGLLAGVVAFGLPGLFLGPVIVVLLYELLREELTS